MAANNLQSEDGGGGVVKSPRTPGHSQAVSSPWTSVTQGSQSILSDTISSAPDSAPKSSSDSKEKIGNFTSDRCPPSTVTEVASSSDDYGIDGQGSDGGGVGGASKKPVWNKPSNGVAEAVSPVMDAISWPALGESTKASPKSSSSESLKALADGTVPPALQVANPSPLQQQTSTNNKFPASNPNHVAPARQRSMKRGGASSNSNVSANGGVSHMAATNQDLVVENTHNTSGKPGTAAAESSPRDQAHVESQRSFGAQSHNGNDHQHQKNPYKRGNGGQHPRGDASLHHNFGGKRDQDRGNLEWNQHSRSFNGRDTHLQPQRGFPRGDIRPSVHTAPFLPPPMPIPMRTFGNSMMYPGLPSPVFYVQGPPPPPESLRAMPLVAPIPPPVYYAVPDPLLHARIVSQIDYYFSNENLIKDTYLRQNMDEQGWVPVSLIAGFKKVLHLTDNVQLILDAMRASTIVEVQGDKIRRQNDWMRWLMQPPAQGSNLSSPQSIGGTSPNQDALAAHIQGVTLDDVGRLPSGQAGGDEA